MQDIHARVRLLEQKLDVITKEFSEVLNEMQTTMAGTIKMVSAALRTLDDRITAVEPPKPRQDDSGKEV